MGHGKSKEILVCDVTWRGIFAGEHDCRCYFFHCEIPNVSAELTPTRGTTRELWTTWWAHEVARVALQDRRQDVVETDGTLEQRRQVLVGRGRRGGCSSGRRCRNRGRGWRGPGAWWSNGGSGRCGCSRCSCCCRSRCRVGRNGGCRGRCGSDGGRVWGLWGKYVHIYIQHILVWNARV